MLIFVYGTLMRSHGNHRVLVELEARWVGEATTAAPRTLVDLGPYPALLPATSDAATERVSGELYEVPDDAIAALDEFEGCPDLYRRERVLLDGDRDVWTYVLAVIAPPHAVVVTSGRYAGGGIVLVTSAREADALDKPR